MKWTCVLCESSIHSIVKPELCGNCGGVRSFANVAAEVPYKRASEIKPSFVKRYSTGIGELDTALGGGIPAGSTIMLWGRGGSGKSRSALRIGTQLGQCLCVSIEMTEELCTATAASAGGNIEKLFITRDESTALPGRGVRCVVWDSISRTVKQEEALVRLEAWAKRTGGVVLLVCHATKGGEYRGPSTLQHWPDAEIRFSQARARPGHARVRVLKSRFCECPASAYVPIA